MPDARDPRSDDPDSHPTAPLEATPTDQAPRPEQDPDSPAAEATPAGPSRWSRMRAAVSARPWVPTVGIALGAALLGAVIASAVFVANPVHEDVRSASENSALPNQDGPSDRGNGPQNGAPGAPEGPGKGGGPKDGPQKGAPPKGAPTPPAPGAACAPPAPPNGAAAPQPPTGQPQAPGGQPPAPGGQPPAPGGQPPAPGAQPQAPAGQAAPGTPTQS